MLKQIVKFALHHSRAMQLVQRLNRDRVRILMYHRFPLEHSGNFDRQCALLAREYKVVSLAEAARRLQGNEPIANLAVITVDDGYADMHDVAFPILQKHALPATLFVTTGFINRTCSMPGDRVRRYFAYTEQESLQLVDDRGEVHVFRTKDPGAADRLRALLKRVPNRTRTHMLAALEIDLTPEDRKIPPADYTPCTWGQLRAMAEGGISMGAHTVTHPILSRLETVEETEREVLESRTCIERELGKPVDLFAYPNGTPEDINAVSVACVHSHFRSAVTAIPGLNAPGADVYQLLRLPCDPDMPIAQLERMLAGPLRRR